MSQEDTRKFLSAAGYGDFSTIRELVSQGLPVDVPDELGECALHKAARGNRAEIVEFLLTNGAAADIKNRRGVTPLVIAAEEGFVEIARLLVTLGANVDEKNPEYGSTALMRAAARGRLQLVEFLLDHGANPLIIDRNGKTALAHATNWGTPDVRRCLEKALAIQPLGLGVSAEPADDATVPEIFTAHPPAYVSDEPFTEDERIKIIQFALEHAEEYGLPERRGNSVVLGSFNIRELGERSRDGKAWALLALICERFDLLSIQEIQDNLEGIRYLKRLLPGKYGLIVSDVTGKYPAHQGRGAERLGFLYNQSVVRRTEVASDISYDRTKVIETLFDNRDKIWEFFNEHAASNKAPKTLPCFLTFMRQPFCVSFEIGDSSTTRPYQFLAVNCHLLWGKTWEDRWQEFGALLDWLTDRAGGKAQERMYYPNILLMGDCNLEMRHPADEYRVEKKLKEINVKLEEKGNRAKVNFPFIDKHPKEDDKFRTAARTENTYDHIAFVFAHERDNRFPTSDRNKKAGEKPDGYDYRVFDFRNMISVALYQRPFEKLSEQEQRNLGNKIDSFNVSDHLPIWVRLPMP